jgi:hypothetical protein
MLWAKKIFRIYFFLTSWKPAAVDEKSRIGIRIPVYGAKGPICLKMSRIRNTVFTFACFVFFELFGDILVVDPGIIRFASGGLQYRPFRSYPKRSGRKGFQCSPKAAARIINLPKKNMYKYVINVEFDAHAFNNCLGCTNFNRNKIGMIRPNLGPRHR